MDVVVSDNKEPQGFIVKFVDAPFQTFRYILTDTGRFVVVNPFGDARIAPDFDTFDQAMSMAFADVENQRASKHHS